MTKNSMHLRLRAAICPNMETVANRHDALGGAGARRANEMRAIVSKGLEEIEAVDARQVAQRRRQADQEARDRHAGARRTQGARPVCSRRARR